MRRINTMVIAAGGKSERLAEYFESVNFCNTKTLFPIKEGKPILGYLIEMAIKNGYEKIFVLASFYDKEIKYFINKFYKKDNIIVVPGGERGRKIGVTKVLSLIKEDLDRPFVYSDGDIFFASDLLDKLSNSKFTDKIMVDCVVSPKDMASTHSRFIIKNRTLAEINVRCNGSIGKFKNAFCSLGLMVINNKIFKQIPEYKNIGDLDLVVKKLFEADTRNVKFHIYKDEWFSIHDKKDIDKIKSGYYNNLFSSFKNKTATLDDIRR